MERAAASADLGRLNAFVGAWETNGEIVAGSSGQRVKFEATDTYEWLPGGHFLLHRFDAEMPEGEVEGIEVIGFDQETKSYPMHSFDSSGTASIMHARVVNDVWTFTGETIRFTGGFRDDGRVFAGVWELRSSDGSAWHPWMDVRLKKVG